MSCQDITYVEYNYARLRCAAFHMEDIEDLMDLMEAGASSPHSRGFMLAATTLPRVAAASLLTSLSGSCRSPSDVTWPRPLGQRPEVDVDPLPLGLDQDLQGLRRLLQC